MVEISRRRMVRWLAMGTVGLAGCDPRRLPDSRRQAWVVLVDLSGTAASDRAYYVRELEATIQELAELRGNVPLHIAGFSSFARPLAGGQAHLVRERLPEVVAAVQRWPRDPKTDIAAAFGMAHELLRTAAVERRLIWMLSDGVHDPTNRWPSRPAVGVPLPDGLPLAALHEQGTAVHWDALDEYQLAGWQRAFEAASLPAVLHLRGFMEAARTRLQRLPRETAAEAGRGGA
jgi:hypothetical protein